MAVRAVVMVTSLKRKETIMRRLMLAAVLSATSILLAPTLASAGAVPGEGVSAKGLLHPAAGAKGDDTVSAKGAGKAPAGGGDDAVVSPKGSGKAADSRHARALALRAERAKMLGAAPADENGNSGAALAQ